MYIRNQIPALLLAILLLAGCALVGTDTGAEPGEGVAMGAGQTASDTVSAPSAALRPEPEPHTANEPVPADSDADMAAAGPGDAAAAIHGSTDHFRRADARLVAIDDLSDLSNALVTLELEPTKARLLGEDGLPTGEAVFDSVNMVYTIRNPGLWDDCEVRFINELEATCEIVVTHQDNVITRQTESVAMGSVFHGTRGTVEWVDDTTIFLFSIEKKGFYNTENKTFTPLYGGELPPVAQQETLLFRDFGRDVYLLWRKGSEGEEQSVLLYRRALDEWTAMPTETVHPQTAIGWLGEDGALCFYYEEPIPYGEAPRHLLQIDLESKERHPVTLPYDDWAMRGLHGQHLLLALDGDSRYALYDMERSSAVLEGPGNAVGWCDGRALVAAPDALELIDLDRQTVYRVLPEQVRETWSVLWTPLGLHDQVSDGQSSVYMIEVD